MCRVFNPNFSPRNMDNAMTSRSSQSKLIASMDYDKSVEDRLLHGTALEWLKLNKQDFLA